MLNKKIKLVPLILVILLILSLVSCKDSVENENPSGTTGDLSTGEPISSAETLDTSDMFSARDLDATYDENGSTILELNDSTGSVTITDEGVYILSGALTNGQIIVNSDKEAKIQLVLNGVNINCDTSSAIYVKQADKVFITLADQSENTLSNKTDFVAIDENNIDAVVFSKDDITFNGSGTLIVNAAYGHGIISKDDLVFAGGEYNITSAEKALSANDCIKILNGTFIINAGKDAIHAENTEDATLGYIYIANGSFEISSLTDGISAYSTLQIDGGTFNIITTSTANSSKGIKSAGNILINGGTLNITSKDDGIHADINVQINNGDITISTGDDGIHADNQVVINGGIITITKCYEGIESKAIDITGGIVSLIASDDGINAAGGSSGGMGMSRADTTCYIKITGGRINVNSTGDGIDSNGSIYVTGGETYVSGPTSSANGPLDYDGSAQITGGVFIAAGSSGMAQNFGTDSTQGSILLNITSSQKGAISLKNDSGSVLLSYTPEKQYNSVVVSCPQIEDGEEYTLVTGSISNNIEMTSLIYGSGGGMGGFGGGQRR